MQWVLGGLLLVHVRQEEPTPVCEPTGTDTFRPARTRYRAIRHCGSGAARGPWSDAVDRHPIPEHFV